MNIIWRMILSCFCVIVARVPSFAQELDTSEFETRTVFGVLGGRMITTASGSFPAVRLSGTARATPVIDASRAESAAASTIVLGFQSYPWQWGGWWLELGGRGTRIAYSGDATSQPTRMSITYMTIGAGLEAAIDIGTQENGPGFVRLVGNTGITIGGPTDNMLETTRYRDSAGSGQYGAGKFGGSESPLSSQSWLGGGIGALVGIAGNWCLRLDARYEQGLASIFNEPGSDIESPTTRLVSIRAGIVVVTGGKDDDVPIPAPEP